MNKTPLNQEPKLQLPPREIVLSLSLDSRPSVLSKADAKECIEYIMQMLTEKQVLELSKKMLRCHDYIKMKEKGMSDKNARSVIRRRHLIQYSKMNEVCEPCQEWMDRNHK